MIGRLLRGIVRERRGAVAPIVAILGTLIVGIAGLALDIGVYYAGNRNLQSITEAAALSAAIDPTRATARAQAFMVSNGYPASSITQVEVGRYCADSSKVGAGRFVATTQACKADGRSNGLNTAVRLHTSMASKRYLTAVLSSAAIPPMVGLATAARIDEAGVGIASGALTLTTPGLVNQLLTALTGRNIALTDQQLQALAASNVDAGLMFDALAARVGETGTYAQLLSRSVSLADLLAACQAGMGPGGNAVTVAALQTLAAQVGSGIQVPLAGLFDLGVWEKTTVGNADTKTALRAGLNAYQLISYAMQENGRTASLAGLTVHVPGIAGVSLVGSATDRLAGARFGFGPAGETTVSTARVRIQLSVLLPAGALSNLLNGLGLSAVQQILLAPLAAVLGTSASVPLLIEVAPASATISSITCGQEAVSDAKVQVTANTGLLYAYLGNMNINPMSRPFLPIASSNVTPVSLVNALGLLTVNVRAVLGPVIGTPPTPLTFVQSASAAGTIGHPPSAGGTAIRVANSAQLGTLLSGLGPNLDIKATLLGLPVLSTSPLLTNVGTALAPIGTLALDPLIDGLLGALGVQPGYSDNWVTGVRCGVPVLV